MGNVKPSSAPVKLFVGMLSRDEFLFNELKGKLKDEFGPLDMESPVWKWEHTNYYRKEMGTGLKRQFFFFQRLINPETISGIKLKTIEIEKQYINNDLSRKVNLDPGYLDSAKVVLVSTKDFSHRICLGKGIYGEVTLFYSKNNYQILPYTYPEFRTTEYFDIFKKARKLYAASI